MERLVLIPKFNIGSLEATLSDALNNLNYRNQFARSFMISEELREKNLAKMKARGFIERTYYVYEDYTRSARRNSRLQVFTKPMKHPDLFFYTTFFSRRFADETSQN